jgi:hypothetical protein
MTGRQLLIKLTGEEEGFKQWDRTSKDKRRTAFKSAMKIANKKIRRDKSFLKEIDE